MMMSDDDSDMVQKMFESCGVNVNFVDCGNEKEKAMKEKKPSSKLSRDEQIKVAALNAAIEVCDIKAKVALAERGEVLIDVLTEAVFCETYIRTGESE